MRIYLPFGPIWLSFRPQKPRVPFGCIVAYFVLVWFSALLLLVEGVFTRR